MSLKDKLSKLNKKNIIIATLILIAILLCSFGGFEFYRFKQFEKIKKEKQQTLSVPVDLSGQPKKPSEYEVGIDYNKAMNSKKPVMALFYADWCGYCIRFMPIFQALSNKYDNEFVFAKVNVEDEKYQELVKNIGITGFPTVFLLDSKYDNKVLISNSVLGNMDKLSEELDRFLRIRKLLDKKK